MHYIYWIYSKHQDINETYIGKTSDFERRMKEHEYSCNNKTNHNYNYPVYNYIRKYGGWEAFCMEILETCDDDVANAREFYWYNEKQATLNKQIPTRNRKAYYAQNRDKILDKFKKYNEQNREQIKEWQTTKITCECGCLSNNANIARHRKSNRHKQNMLKLLEAKSHNNL